MDVKDIKGLYSFHIFYPNNVVEAELKESGLAYNVVDIEARTVNGSFRAMFDGKFMYSQSKEGCAICKEIWHTIGRIGLSRFRPASDEGRYINLVNLL